MTTSILLRIAAVISALFTIGHSMGGLKKWSPMGDNDVLRKMTDVQFDTMGIKRSYLDFFLGFGWSISIAMILQTVLLWQMANVARTNAILVRPMIGIFALEVLVSAIIAWRFLFPIPALFSLALLIPLVLAFAVTR